MSKPEPESIRRNQRREVRSRSRTPQRVNGSTSAAAPGWKWRTFPVFAAFMAGLLIAVLINGEPNNTAAAVVVWIAVIGCSYALAHFITMKVYLPRRRRRAASADTYEDVVVYPDEQR